MGVEQLFAALCGVYSEEFFFYEECFAMYNVLSCPYNFVGCFCSIQEIRFVFWGGVTDNSRAVKSASWKLCLIFCCDLERCRLNFLFRRLSLCLTPKDISFIQPNLTNIADVQSFLLSQMSWELKIKKKLKTVPHCLGKFRPTVGQCCHQCTPDSLVSMKGK